MKRSRDATVGGLDDAELKELLATHSPFLQLTDEGRIRCTFNGHVMPARRDAIETLVSGAKYQRLRQREEEAAGFAAYKPFLIDSKNYKDKLYCALTCMLLNRSLDSIRKHMKGKAFLKAKESYEKEEHDLMEEPDLEDSSEPSEGATVPEQDGEVLAELGAMELDSQGREGDAVSNSVDDASEAPPASSKAAKRGEETKQVKKKKKEEKKQAMKVTGSPGAPDQKPKALQPHTPPQQPGKAAVKSEKDRDSRRARLGKAVPKKPRKEAC